MTQIVQQQNLKVSYQYITWVNGTNRGIMAHIYKFTSQAGTTEYFTDLDTDLYFFGNQQCKSGSLRIEGLKRKVGVGVSVDEQTIKIWASPTDTLFGSLFLQGAQQGLLDGAQLVRYRVIWPFVTGNAANDVQLPPLALFPMFTGYISSIDKGGASHIEVKIKSALMRLNVNMPRNYYQPGCLHTLFDSGCTLSEAAHGVTGTINTFGGNMNAVGPVGGVTNPNGADGNANYAQGRLRFTSGVNNGFLTLVDNNDGTNLFLAYPLDQAPSPGDTIIYYPGCAKTFVTCGLKFSNTAHFRGFDKVPPISVSI
jgi:uncharacterized phage protein (TIGR02218 family)